jgi:Tol biopolymer transport system component
VHTYENPQTIVVMNADGSGRETILNHWGSPRWSPKGNRIATIGEQRTIALFDLATGIEHTTFDAPHSLWQGFSVSPSGLQFCFGDTNGGVGLATLDERTMRASVRRLVKSGTTYHSSWSPHGTRIVFQWKPPNEEFYQLYTIEPDGSQPPQRLPGQDPRRHNCDPDWSPDGKTIVFNSQSP